ncbi:hypothetical protein PG990_013885 [Apiospora arundinis]
MQIIQLLIALFFAATQAHGAVVPGKAPRDGSNNTAVPDVTVKFVLANGTVVESTPGIKQTQSNFIHKPDTQSICTRSGLTGPMTDHFARSDDCNQLVTYLTTEWLGYWDTWDYDEYAIILISAGTCAFFLSGVQAFSGHVWIGNQDVADAVAYVVDKYTHDGLVAAAGQINCQHPSGATELDWSVQKSDL